MEDEMTAKRSSAKPPKAAVEGVAETPKAAEAEEQENTLASKIATVAVIGLGAALIEVELIPGMLIGAAAVLAPNFMPKLGGALRPLLKSTVKAGYALVAKTKETMAEAGEHFQDIVAEAKAEAEDDAAQAHPVI
jgi:hypothetical protein